jgi:chromate transporter
MAGALGAVVATWATFAPCFLWIFLGGPYIERLRGNQALTTTLSAITAAVVGVILNLALTLAIQTLFDRVRFVQVLGGPVPLPSWSSLDLFAAVVATSSFVVLWRFKVNILWVIGVSALAGAVRVLA